MDFSVGIDEVGRGAWAGPLLVVAAKAMLKLPEGLTDSKLLSQRARLMYFDQIKQTCLIGEGWVEPEEIDQNGLADAIRVGVSRALIMIGAETHESIILDGPINYCPVDYINVRYEPKADFNYPIVSAASIYAKVLRDKYMQAISKFYSNYGFDKHVGYGTELHQKVLVKYGVSKLHRKSFKPVREILVKSSKLETTHEL